jgi:hypothetical protein
VTSVNFDKDAWKHDAQIREWFEVVFDTAVDPHIHTAYICKSCGQPFQARTSPFELLRHAKGHSGRRETPDSGVRMTALSGEKIVELHQLLMQEFEIVAPEAETWKFQCRRCNKRLPHRTNYRDLLGHSLVCPAAVSSASVQ